MLYIYTTGDGKAYSAEDGTLIIVGSLELITDRTLSDVESVRTLAEAIKAGTATEEQVQQYLGVRQKGAYTHEDMNRVEIATAYVAERLKELGYLSLSPAVHSWSVNSKPNEVDFTVYFGNVKTLRDAITVWMNTPEAPYGVIGFDVDKANALEQILVDIDQILNLMQDAWFYSGDLYSAEV